MVERGSQKILRLMDVNLNRCREGLRVLEDTARLLWNNPSWFKQLRALRHQMDALTRPQYAQLLAARQSQKDPGRAISEGKRPSVQAVAFANFRRCEESLRVLEEYAKLFSGEQSAQFKAARFKMYRLEKKIVQKIYEA